MAKEIITQTQTHTISTKVLPEEKYQLAKNLVAKNASDAEFELLAHLANKYDLDPFLKEIWCIKRNSNDTAQIYTSRDGYLKIAKNSGKLDGIESYTIDDEKGKPVKAVCKVFHKDMQYPIKAEVKFSEYYQETPVWKKYPSAMLIKVAEVFALKRAFSINGLLTQEELDPDANNQRVYAEPTENDQTVNKVTKDQLKVIVNLIKEVAGDDKTRLDEIKQSLQEQYGTAVDMTQEQADEAIEYLQCLLGGSPSVVEAEAENTKGGEG